MHYCAKCQRLTEWKMVCVECDPGKRLLTLTETKTDEGLVSAETAGLSIGMKPDTIRRWARDGKIPSYKVRGGRRFRISDLTKLVVASSKGQS